MKRFSTLKIRTILSLLILAVTIMIQAQPPETEYPGTIIRSGYTDDRNYGPLSIGFDFDFFGNTYSEFYVTTNGLVMFGSGSNQYTNNTIPTASGANNYIAPFWDDLIIHSSGDIMYQSIGTAPNRKLVVQFNNMSFWNSTVLLGTIQVILYEGSNNIQMQYRSIVDLSSDRASGNSATVGLENIDGSDGVLCSYNTAGYIQSEKAILFTPGGGTYTYDDNALYDGVILVDAIPRAGIPPLVSPAYNSTVGDTVTFQWEAASNASSYFVVISQNSDLSSPIHTSADLTTLSYEYILSPDQTYYWSCYAKNSVGTISWSEIWLFQTSSTPPLLAVPQTMYLEQGDSRSLSLLFTGGDAGSKTATVTLLPTEGALYQNSGGIPGAQITAVPTDVTDPSFSIFYSASGAAGNGVGNFDFHFSDATGTSADETYIINVSPPGIPNFMYASKEIDRVEITFDRDMADPSGKHLEFAVEDNGVGVTSTSCELKAGDPTTIVVYVSPNLNTANAIAVAYTRGTVEAESGGILESFDFQLAGKLAQVINFSALIDRTYGDADFALSASASSGLPVTFSSSNSTVVSVSGTTATVNNAGETLIYATQAGDATYAAVTFERHQLVNKAVAAVTLSNLTQEYSGTGIAATVTTVPPALSTKTTYDGLPELPVDIGSYVVLAEVEEANYSGSATDNILITDLSAPVPDVDPLPDLTDECSVTPVAPTATDLYAGVLVGTTPTPFPVTTQGTTVITWTYDDGNGNTTTQDQTLIIDDVTDPDIPVLGGDVTGECSATAPIPTTTDNCAGTITATTTDPLTYTEQGIYEISWIFDDGNGNSITVLQNVVVDDVTDPEIPILGGDVIGECSATAAVPTTTDACAGIITGTTTDPLTYTEQGIFEINWTFDDGNGNSITVLQNVVVDDVTDPLTPTLADLSGECSVTAVPPTTTDNCAGTITGTTSDPLTYSTQGAYVINWTFDDGNGNSIVVPQNVLVDDLTDPVIPVLADVIGECSATAVAPSTTDACAGTITGTSTDPLTYTTQGTFVINWTFDDGNGNSITVPQNVIVDDVTDPLIPALTDVMGECSATAVVPTTTDACAGTITGTSSDPLTYTTVGTHVITWTFDDGNGNSIDVTQNVIVSDGTPPLTPGLADLTGECSVTAVAPTTTDDCAGTITGTTSDPLTYATQGSFVITWTFDDGNGNSITVPQNVIVADVSDPVIPTLTDLSGECSVTALAPTTTDNCAGTVTGTTSDPLTYATQGSYVINWTFDDGNGNSISVPQNVLVADVTPPSATAPADLVTCDGTVASIALTNVTDNCTTPFVSFELSGATIGSGTGDASAEVFAPGVTTVSYTLDDGNGNTSQYTFTVTYQVLDEIVVSNEDGTLSCETTGSYQWINCEDNTILDGETSSTFTPATSGDYAVILTQGSCSDTSECYSVTVSGIGNNNQAQAYRIYPNPAHNFVTIDMVYEQSNMTLKVFDLTGNLLRMEELDRITKTNLDLSEYKAGMYMIQIHSDQVNSVARIIKE